MKQTKAPNVRAVQSDQTQNGRIINGSSAGDLHARVAVLAYSLYEGRGREHGHDLADWIQAENTILEEIAPRDNRARTRSKS